MHASCSRECSSTGQSAALSRIIDESLFAVQGSRITSGETASFNTKDAKERKGHRGLRTG